MVYLLLGGMEKGLEGPDGARGIWTADVVGGMSGYVLTWTLFYGLVRA